MIFQKELHDIAERLKIQASVLDKDWVLGHFLNAMFEIESIRNNFVFKGGTCLKKCYFNDYRYSEDLDFTLIDKDFIVDEVLINSILSIVRKNSGAEFYLNKIKPQTHKNIPQGYEITIAFWGADHKPNQTITPVERWQTKIKLDISFSEKSLLQADVKQIFHPYSDFERINNTVSVYPINEIVAEKIRALMQRNRPRDVYDLYFLSQKINSEEHSAIYSLLKQKSKNKDLDCCKIENYINPIKARKNKRAWENSLGHHLAINRLIEFDMAYETVGKFVLKIISHK